MACSPRTLPGLTLCGPGPVKQKKDILAEPAPWDPQLSCSVMEQNQWWAGEGGFEHLLRGWWGPLHVGLPCGRQRTPGPQEPCPVADSGTLGTRGGFPAHLTPLQACPVGAARAGHPLL